MAKKRCISFCRKKTNNMNDEELEIKNINLNNIIESKKEDYNRNTLHKYDSLEEFIKMEKKDDSKYNSSSSCTCQTNEAETSPHMVTIIEMMLNTIPEILTNTTSENTLDLKSDITSEILTNTTSENIKSEILTTAISENTSDIKYEILTTAISENTSDITSEILTTEILTTAISENTSDITLDVKSDITSDITSKNIIPEILTTVISYNTSDITYNITSDITSENIIPEILTTAISENIIPEILTTAISENTSKIIDDNITQITNIINESIQKSEDRILIKINELKEQLAFNIHLYEQIINKMEPIIVDKYNKSHIISHYKQNILNNRKH